MYAIYFIDPQNRDLDEIHNYQDLVDHAVISIKGESAKEVLSGMVTLFNQDDIDPVGQWAFMVNEETEEILISPESWIPPAKMTEKAVNQIVATMLNQLGGKRFMTMTGSKLVEKSVDERNNVSMTLSLIKNRTIANRLKVTYISKDDMYDMEFFRVTVGKNSKSVSVETYRSLFWDQLEEFFIGVTGLHTKLY